MHDECEAAASGAFDPVTLPIESEAPAASERGLRALLAVTREALTSAERDYTSGPIGRAVILLAIPMVLEMAMESLFAICDVFYVSRLGRRGGRRRRPHRGADDHPLLDRRRHRHGRHRHGRPPHRREAARRGGDRDRAGDRGRRCDLAPRRHPGCAAGAAPAARDGRLARPGRDRRRLHRGPARGLVHGRAAVHDQRGVPRRRRRGAGDAHAVDRQRRQHRPRPVPDLRARAVPRDGAHRGGGRHRDRPRHRHRVPGRGARPRARPDPRRARAAPPAPRRDRADSCACRSAARCSTWWRPRAGWRWCASSAASAPRPSPATRSPSASSCSRCCRRGAWRARPRR